MLRASVTAGVIGYSLADACKGIWPTINRNIVAAGENWQRFVLRKNEVVIPLYNRVCLAVEAGFYSNLEEC